MKTNTPSTLACMLLAVVLLGSLPGCTTSQRASREWNKEITNNVPRLNPYTSGNMLFSTIEFDDQGEMWDRNQLSGTLGRIREFKREGHPVILMVFVHGWKHDASVNSSNFAGFFDFIQTVASLEWKPNDLDKTKEAKIVGVYIGWRGNKYQYGNRVARLLTWLPLQTTFYNRKSTAAKVAGLASTEAILSLAAQTRLNYGSDTNQSKVIIIGHSFGGLIVERAITHAMLGGILMNPSLASDWQAQQENAKKDLAETQRELSEKRERLLAAVSRAFPLHYGFNSQNTNDSQIHQNARDAQRQLRQDATWIGAELEPSAKEARRQMGKAKRLWSEAKDAAKSISQDVETLRPDTIPFMHLHFLNPFNHDEALAVTNILSLKSNLEGSIKVIRNHAQFGLVTNRFTKRLVRNFERASQECLTILTKPNGKVQKYESDPLTLELTRLRAKMADITTNLDLFVKSSQRSNDLYFEATTPALVASKPPADLVLLFNPASEALIAKMMIDALENNSLIHLRNQFTTNDRPWIVSVSSKGDWATRVAFPLGRTFPAMFQSFRKYSERDYQFVPAAVAMPGANPSLEFSRKAQDGSQKSYFLTTGPHYDAMMSHQIKEFDKVDATNRALFSTTANILRNNLLMNSVVDDWKYIATSNSLYILKERQDAENCSSYWVIRTDKSLISDHNAVFTPEFYALTAAFLRMSQVAPALKPEAVSTPKDYYKQSASPSQRTELRPTAIRQVDRRALR
ncbi:MAG TPA: alpha/beta hydrolase family protein [Verrucomicrobiae bacterium]|nr:alpha/beta hydrolase family protein [Verrucomicrobiae bacterium]